MANIMSAKLDPATQRVTGVSPPMTPLKGGKSRNQETSEADTMNTAEKNLLAKYGWRPDMAEQTLAERATKQPP